LPTLGNDVVGAIGHMLGPGAQASGGTSVLVDGISSDEKVRVSDIQEIRINKNPYSAEVAKPGTNRIEIITKSGATEYHASLCFGIRDYRAHASNAFAREREPERHRQLDASFSGPLGDGKKTNFSISVSHSRDDLRPPIYAVGLQGPILDNASQGQRYTSFSA